MEKNKIRSEYIRNIVKEKDDLKKKLDEMANESLKDIIGEEVNKKLHNIISESDEDSYTEEEVDSPDTDDNSTDNAENKPETVKTDDDAETDTDNINADDTETFDDDTTDADDSESADTDDDDDIMNDIEKYKDADGEFDLRGMDNDQVVKVLKLISKDDNNGIRVYKDPSNDTIVLNDDDTEKQYVIDLDDSNEGDEDVDVDVTEEGCERCKKGMNEELGYTDNYQGETAMSVDSNSEPASSSDTYSMDAGVPTGTEKPYGKNSNGKMAPFTDSVNEEDEYDFEIETDDDDDEPVEEATSVGGFAAQNSTAKSHVPNSDGRSARNKSKGGEYSGTQTPRYTNEQLNRIMKKANKIFTENKEFKGIISELKNQINEAIVINYNMGRVIKLVTENSTSKEEKLNIIEQFDKVRTLQEAKDTFAKIDSELKNPTRIAKINNAIDKQLSESATKKQTVEDNSIYHSEDLNQTLSFMARLNTIK